MPKKKENQPITYSEIEKLIGQQTKVILDALSEKTSILDKRLILVEKRLDVVDKRFDLMEKKMEKMEERINKKIDHLATILDKFLKRITDMEDEFEIMKAATLPTIKAMRSITRISIRASRTAR